MLLDIRDNLPTISLVPASIEFFGARPNWTTRLPERSSGSASPRFSRQSCTRAASSVPMIIRASEPPIKERRSWAVATAFGKFLCMATSRLQFVVAHVTKAQYHACDRRTSPIWLKRR